MTTANSLIQIASPKEISQTALREINSMLASVQGLNYPYQQLGLEWIRDYGKYTGTIPKRLERWCYNEYRIKIKKGLLERIGQIAKASLPSRTTYTYLDFHKKIDWEKGTFGDYRSCFWGSKSDAKYMLEGDPTFNAIRHWDKSGSTPYGRCFSVVRGDCLVLFNAYGRMQLQAYAALMSTWTGVNTYEQISLLNDGVWEGTLHLNQGKGFIVGKYPGGALDLHLKIPESLVRTKCRVCGGVSPAEKMVTADHGNYNPSCPACVRRHFEHRCGNCGDHSYQPKEVIDHFCAPVYWCKLCCKLTTRCINCDTLNSYRRSDCGTCGKSLGLLAITTVKLPECECLNCAPQRRRMNTQLTPTQGFGHILAGNRVRRA